MAESSLKEMLANSDAFMLHISQESYEILQHLFTEWEAKVKPTMAENHVNHDSELSDFLQYLVQCAELSSDRELEGMPDDQVKEDVTSAAALLGICSALLRADHQVFEEKQEITMDTGLSDSGDPVCVCTAQHQRFLLKRVSVPLVALCAAHAEPHPWTNEESCSAAKELLHLICFGCKCPSVCELLSGHNEATADLKSSSRLYPRGLLHHILDYLRPKLMKDTWKKFPTALHACVWCVMQVKYPYLGEHLPKLLPSLLLFMDDFQAENKLIGLACLKHVIDNVNKTELHWYGRANVIYEALRHLIYTNEPAVFRALCPCIHSILEVIDGSPKPCRKANRCDDVFHFILTSMEFEGKIPMRRAYASQLQGLIRMMGITVLRHIKRLLDVVFSYLSVYDGPDEQCRLAVLDALHTLLLCSWPRIDGHADAVVRHLLKLLVDISDAGTTITHQAKTQIIKKSAHCLATLRMCCGDQFQESWMLLQKGLGHSVVDECISISMAYDATELQQPFTETSDVLSQDSHSLKAPCISVTNI